MVVNYTRTAKNELYVEAEATSSSWSLPGTARLPQNARKSLDHCPLISLCLRGLEIRNTFGANKETAMGLEQI